LKNPKQGFINNDVLRKDVMSEGKKTTNPIKVSGGNGGGKPSGGTKLDF